MFALSLILLSAVRSLSQEAVSGGHVEAVRICAVLAEPRKFSGRMVSITARMQEGGGFLIGDGCPKDIKLGESRFDNLVWLSYVSDSGEKSPVTDATHAKYIEAVRTAMRRNQDIIVSIVGRLEARPKDLQWAGYGDGAVAPCQIFVKGYKGFVLRGKASQRATAPSRSAK